jgi:outer membrane protein assembly factor BamB/serine/threonine protein kinase
MDGGSLADRLNETDGLAIEEAVWIGERLCRGLELAHNNGVAHLDLKPQNILFRETRGRVWDVPKIADWGLARELLGETSDPMEMLSPRYAAPEQFDSARYGRVDPTTDIYQLGAVVYAMLTGEPPYTGRDESVMLDIAKEELPPPPSQRRSELSEELDAVIQTAVEPRKDNRFGSVETFKQALRAVRDGRRLPHSVGTNHSETNSGQQIAPSKTDEEIRPPALIGTETRSQQEGVVCRKRIDIQTTDEFRGVVIRFQLESSRSDSVRCVLTETLPSDVLASDVSVIGDSSGTWNTTNTKTEVRFETTLSPDEALTTAYGIPGTTIDRSAPVTGEPRLYVRPTPSQTQWQMFGCGPTRKGTPAGHTGPDAPVTTRWQFNTDRPVRSSPAVADGTMYVGSNDCSLYAVDAATGNKRWQFDTDGEVYSSPAVADGTVYVGSRYGLYAVDAATGNKRWQFGTSEKVYSSPAVVDGTVYVGSRDNSLYAVDAATGDKQWQFGTGGWVNSSPAVVGGTVYVGSGDFFDVSGSLCAVDVATGNQQWQFDTSGRVRSSPAVVGGTVYVGSEDYSLYAVDAATGDKQWQFDTSGAVRSSPAVVDSTVYVGSWDNSLYAVDAATGNQQWQFDTDGHVDSSPAVVDGAVYVGSGDHSLYAVDAATGDKQWQFNTDGQVRLSPAVVDGTVYVGSGDDNLYAIEKKE